MNFPGQGRPLGRVSGGSNQRCVLLFPGKSPFIQASRRHTPLVASSPNPLRTVAVSAGHEGWSDPLPGTGREPTEGHMLPSVLQELGSISTLHLFQTPTRQAGGCVRHDRCLAQALDRMKKRRMELGQVAENSGGQLRGGREMAERGSPGPGGSREDSWGGPSAHFCLSSDVYVLVRAGGAS